MSEGVALPRLTVVIPALDAADTILDTVGRLRSELADVVDDLLEIVVVDDGSSDRTAELARAAGADVVHSHPKNLGKGAAVRTGFRLATGRTVAFTDADLAYSPDRVAQLLTAIEAGADMAIGSRAHAQSDVAVPASALRNLSTRLFNGLTRLVLTGRYRDTQCGLKGFTQAAANLMANHMRIRGFAFDVELLHLAERYDLELVEVPVTLSASHPSSVRLALAVPQMIRDLLLIRWHGRRGGYGEAKPVPAPGSPQ